MSTVEEDIAPATTDEDLEQVIGAGVVDTKSNLKVQTKKWVLATLLDKASTVLPTKDVAEVLKNFQVEAHEGGTLRVTATDLELSVVAQANLGTVERPGTAIFPGKTLETIVKEAADGEMLLDVADGTATITVGSATWKLRLRGSSDDYPPLPEPGNIDFEKVKRENFIRALQSVRHAASQESTRLDLMLLDIAESKDRMVMRAADGIRFQQVDMTEWWPQGLELQIPVAAVDQLLRLLTSTSVETIELGESEDFLVFRIGGVDGDVFIVNKLTVTYPDVDGMLLNPWLKNDQVLHVDKAALASTIKRVRIAADPDGRIITLHLGPNKLRVAAKDKYDNQAEETLDCAWEGPDKSLAFNHMHLLQMLSMATAKTCTFYLAAEEKKTRPSPILLKDEEAGLLGVLNQLRADLVS